MGYAISLRGSVISAFEGARKFFGLAEGEVYILFSPNTRRPWASGKKLLGDNATRKQVAASIRQFVAWKESLA